MQAMKIAKVARSRQRARQRRKKRLNLKVELLKAMPANSICAEIGVWKGDLSSAILGVVKPARLHLIDPWLFMNDELYEKSWYGTSKSITQTDMDGMHDSVNKRFKREIDQGIVQIHRCLSEEAVDTFTDEYFDWVYIDGNHLYEYVKKDLYGYVPKIKRNGCIAGDDYATDGWFDGSVKKTVDEFAANESAELRLLLGKQFVLYKR